MKHLVEWYEREITSRTPEAVAKELRKKILGNGFDSFTSEPGATIAAHYVHQIFRPIFLRHRKILEQDQRKEYPELKP